MTRKPGSAAITAPKPYSEAVFIDASSAPPMAALLPSANLAITGLPREDQHGEDADQQRAFDRPDRRDPRHFVHHRRGVAGQLELRASAVELRDHVVKQHVRSRRPDQQRQQRDQRIGQSLGREPRGLVGVPFAVAFAGRGAARRRHSR